MRLLAVAVVVALMAAQPSIAHATPDDIAPGDYIGNCTVAFAFKDATSGKTYMTTASHCLPDKSGSGVGTKINHVAHAVVGAHDNGDGSITFGLTGRGTTPLGIVVEAGGYPRTNNNYANDWALIEVYPDVADRVVGKVRGSGDNAFPTGYAKSANTQAGDVLYHSGYGQAYQGSDAARENRYGVLTWQDAKTYGGYSPTFFGDSGGPVTDFSTGEAMGLVTGFGGVVVGANTEGSDYRTGINMYGPTVEHFLAVTDALGYDLELMDA